MICSPQQCKPEVRRRWEQPSLFFPAPSCFLAQLESIPVDSGTVVRKSPGDKGSFCWELQPGAWTCFSALASCWGTTQRLQCDCTVLGDVCVRACSRHTDRRVFPIVIFWERKRRKGMAEVEVCTEGSYKWGECDPLWPGAGNKQ